MMIPMLMRPRPCLLPAFAAMLLLAVQPVAAQPVPQQPAVANAANDSRGRALPRTDHRDGAGRSKPHPWLCLMPGRCCLKLSGMLTLAGDPRLAPWKADAARLVRDFSYRDEKGGKPKNDEQGTRDRSFILTAEFDEAGSTAFLQNSASSHGLPAVRCLASSSRCSRAREDSSLPAIPRRRICSALRCWRPRPSGEYPSCCPMLPRSPASAPMTWRLLPSRPRNSPKLLPEGRRGVADRPPGLGRPGAAVEFGLAARLARRLASSKSQQWKLAAVTFDEAFRQGIGGAAQILAGQQ